jgi:hypothetical protein
VNDSPRCRHLHTQVIAKDSEAEYVECLGCGAILDPLPGSTNHFQTLNLGG